jgi:hypothetical protein
MTTLNDLNYVDDSDDVMAVHINNLMASTMRSEYKNVETLSATRTLLDVDTPIQSFDCNGANRIVKMPAAETVENHPYLIANSTASGAYTLTVQNNAGTENHVTLSLGQSAFLLPNGNGGYTAIRLSSKSPATPTALEGLQLIWNSGTSLSVGTGVGYAQNGDLIEVVSLLTASSLSLSNSTWYHIYVYLSSGTPAMEVVTTAPVAWKNGAYSKTGDTSRRYVGSVKTNGSGSVYNFTHDPVTNLILYVNQALNASPFRCLSVGTATTATSVSLTGSIPVTARNGWLRFINTSDQTIYLGADNTLSVTVFQLALVAGNVVQTSQILFAVISSTQTVHYLLAGAAGVGGASLDVYGYTYSR